MSETEKKVLQWVLQPLGLLVLGMLIVLEKFAPGWLAWITAPLGLAITVAMLLFWLEGMSSVPLGEGEPKRPKTARTPRRPRKVIIPTRLTIDQIVGRSAYLVVLLLGALASALFVPSITAAFVGLADIAGMVVFLWGFWAIPIVRIGVVERLNARLRIVLKEGTYWMFPWVHKVHILIAKLFNNEVSAVVTCLDKITMKIKGDLQAIVNSEGTDRQGRNRAIELDETTIKRGIDAAIEQELGFIAGVHESSYFWEKREVIARIIECVLKLPRMPHADKKFLKKVAAVNPIDRAWLNLTRTKIKPEHRVEFYEAYQDDVEDLLEDSYQIKQESKTEKRYGLDVVMFAFTQIEFDQATTEAQQAEEQIKLFRKAMGIPDDERLDPAIVMALLGKAEQKNLDIVGLADAAEKLGAGIGRGLRGR